MSRRGADECSDWNTYGTKTEAAHEVHEPPESDDITAGSE